MDDRSLQSNKYIVTWIKEVREEPVGLCNVHVEPGEMVFASKVNHLLFALYFRKPFVQLLLLEI